MIDLANSSSTRVSAGAGAHKDKNQSDQRNREQTSDQVGKLHFRFAVQMHQAPNHRRQYQQKQGESKNRQSDTVPQTLAPFHHFHRLLTYAALHPTNHGAVRNPAHGQQSGGKILLF